MQNVISKQLTIEDIIQYYKNSESQNQKIGLEYEQISINTTDFKQAKFENLFEIIKVFSKINNFELIYDENTIIGAKNEYGTSVSLEPGGQFEISLAPKSDLFEIQSLMEKYLNQLDILGANFNTKFLSIGCNPKICYQNMQILNKRRYKIMAEYLPKYGHFAPVMMRETAGVQINIDYKNEFDGFRKLKTSALMSPFLTGFFANSPFRNNKLTNYKSFRALAWKFTGYNRCNLFYRNLIDSDFENFYEKYINNILNVPMLFIERNNQYININGKITFKEFMQNGFMNYTAQINDYITHQSLCFPDIRLKNCLEIRNHDSQNLEVAIAIGAIYKGILYSNTAIDTILDFLKPLSTADLEHFGFLAAKYGLNFKIDKLNMEASTIVKKILYTAQYNLDINEQKYLDWLIDLATSKRCIADLVLENIRK